ncbi:MAG: hypothetical protein HC784_13100 [Hydrococcus sp. CSU_1_8]|nr:hypothetical protein [Hydrococcus sp. CSU_1_8]
MASSCLNQLSVIVGDGAFKVATQVRPFGRLRQRHAATTHGVRPVSKAIAVKPFHNLIGKFKKLCIK